MFKKKYVFLLFLILLLPLLTACSPKKNYVGKWQTDIFNQGKTQETGGKIAGHLFGGVVGELAQALAGQVHWYATMEIKEDGTLTMDSGELFDATWKEEGDHILIEGDNIYGTATLSSDQKTLIFKNKVREESANPNGFSIGSDYIEFEFEKVE